MVDMAEVNDEYDLFGQIFGEVLDDPNTPILFKVLSATSLLVFCALIFGGAIWMFMLPIESQSAVAGVLVFSSLAIFVLMMIMIFAEHQFVEQRKLSK